MSRKSLRNASKHASKNTSKIGLSRLALGSVALGMTGLLHAQSAQPVQPTGKTPKPKADQKAAKSNRWRAVRLASNAAPAPASAGMAAPAGQGLVTQNTAAANTTGPAAPNPDTAESANA